MFGFFRRRKTVASVIAGFTRVLADLEAVMDQSEAAVTKNDAVIQAAAAANATAHAEADRAERIHAKLAAIIEG